MSMLIESVDEAVQQVGLVLQSMLAIQEGRSRKNQSVLEDQLEDWIDQNTFVQRFIKDDTKICVNPSIAERNQDVTTTNNNDNNSHLPIFVRGQKRQQSLLGALCRVNASSIGLIRKVYELNPKPLTDRDALHLACEFASPNVVRFLVHQYPKATTLLDASGYLPIRYATTRGHVHISRLVASPQAVKLYLIKKESVYKVTSQFPYQKLECYTKAVFPNHTLDLTFASNFSGLSSNLQYSYIAVTEHRPCAIIGTSSLPSIVPAVGSSLATPVSTTSKYRIHVVACWNQANFDRQLPQILQRLAPQTLHCMKFQISSETVQSLPSSLQSLDTINLSSVQISNEAIELLLSKSPNLSKVILDKMRSLDQISLTNVPTALFLVRCSRALLRSTHLIQMIATTVKLKTLLIETAEDEDDDVLMVLEALSKNSSIDTLALPYSPRVLQRLLEILKRDNVTLKALRNVKDMERRSNTTTTTNTNNNSDDQTDTTSATAAAPIQESERLISLYLAWNSMDRRSFHQTFDLGQVVRTLSFCGKVGELCGMLNKDRWFQSDEAVVTLSYLLLREHPAQWATE